MSQTVGMIGKLIEDEVVSAFDSLYVYQLFTVYSIKYISKPFAQ